MTPCDTRRGRGTFRRVTRRRRAWLPATGWAVALAVLSSIPGTALPVVEGWNADKLVHGLLYLVLGLLCARALAATTSLEALALVSVATALATAYGVTDELHQLLTPRRSCDWRDVVADGVGALVGAGIALYLRPTRRGNFTPAV